LTGGTIDYSVMTDFCGAWAEKGGVPGADSFHGDRLWEGIPLGGVADLFFSVIFGSRNAYFGEFSVVILMNIQ